MKTVITFILTIVSYAGNSQTNDKVIHDLKAGRVPNDISYIYWLPFAEGKKFFLIQAYNSKMSHKNELSLDFKMKKGSRVCAAREGVVEQVKKDSDKGGLKDEYLSEGNHIIIRHADGSAAQYWHLQKDGAVVNEGDSVRKGQVIGFSGNTGYTAFPHLHFQVVDQYKQDLPTRFYTQKGVKYLRPTRSYRCIHK